MDKISRHIGYAVLAAAVLALGGCVTTKVANKAAEIEGHYAYEHSWSYDLDGWHISVHETGTMDFYDDGTALDYAIQVYEFTLLNSGCKASRQYLYFSPSRWRVEGDDFYFSGIKDSFPPVKLSRSGCNAVRVRDISCLSEEEWKNVDELAKRIIKNTTVNIGKETKFHYSKPSKKVLVWTYTYSDGHTDTWEFRRLHSARKKPHFQGYGCVGGYYSYGFKDINTFDSISDQKKIRVANPAEAPAIHTKTK